MTRFRKKPVEVEAFRWEGQARSQWPDWARESSDIHTADGLFIQTFEGVMQAKPGDWIIQGVAGEIYPCRPDIFAATYDQVPTLRRIDEVILRVRAAAEAKEKAQEDRKVIGLWDRAPYTHPDVQEASESDPVNKIVDQPVDEDAIETLEMALEQARRGGVTGAIVLMGLAALEDSDVVTDVSMLNSLNTADNLQIFLGGLETAKAELIEQFNDQWLEDDFED